MKQPARFHVVQGTPAPDTPAERVRAKMRAHDKPAEMIACPRCSGREFVQTVTGVLMRRGKAVGGAKALLCVACLAHGERVAVL